MLSAAIASPPSAGPIARLTLELVLLMATTASKSSLVGASMGVMSSQAGAARAPHAPSRNVVVKRTNGVVTCSATIDANATEMTRTANWAPMSIRRASTMSVRTPAGSVRRNIGRVVATCTADTIIGSGLRLVISQLDAVSNIAIATFDNELATRMTVNGRLAKTPQRDLLTAGGSGFTAESSDNAISARMAGTAQIGHVGQIDGSGWKFQGDDETGGRRAAFLSRESARAKIPRFFSITSSAPCSTSLPPSSSAGFHRGASAPRWPEEARTFPCFIRNQSVLS